MKTPDPTKAESSAPDSAKFSGTDNPRQLRAITVLMHRPISRQELDSVAGCANGPELIADLRAKGLEIPCERIEVIDRDGSKCYPGVYSLSKSDHRKVRNWLKHLYTVNTKVATKRLNGVRFPAHVDLHQLDIFGGVNG